MKKIIYFFILGLILLSCNPEKKKADLHSTLSDSLEFYFKKANDRILSKEQRLLFNQKAEAIVVQNAKDSIYLKNLFKVANRYYNIKELEEYKRTSKIIEKKAFQVKDSTNLAKVYSYLGDYYKDKMISDSAYLYYFKAEKIYTILHDKENLGRMHLNKAFIQYKEGDFLGCEISVFKALGYFRNIEDKSVMYDSYNTLGKVFNELKEYDKAIEYHNKTLEILDKTTISNIIQAKATSLNNLGLVYQDNNKNKEAIVYFKIALEEENLSKETPIVYATLLDNLAYSQFKLKEYSQLPDLFYKALTIRDSLQIIPGIVINKLHLSEYHQDQNDTVKAMQFAQEAYGIAVTKGIDARDILLSLKQLAVVNPVKGTVYSKEYITISDSIQQAERKIRNKLARIAFETDELVIEKEKLAEQNRNSMIWFGILIFIGILLFVIRYQRSKNKELKVKEAQQQVNEEIYSLLLSQQDKIEEVRQFEKKRIAQELHDGVMNRLASTRMNLYVLNKKTDTETIQKCLVHIKEIQNIEKEIRAIAHDLDHVVFSGKNDFKNLLTTLVKEYEEISDTYYLLTIDPVIEWDTIKNNIKIHVYRIMQEVLQNIYKYAQARKVIISIYKKENQLEVRIVDDGVGFETKQEHSGIGLKNIRSRIKALYGVVEITSGIEKGTSLSFTIPLSFLN